MSTDETNADESIEASRRQYLFGAGAALGTLGLLGSAGRSAAAENYETITVGPGETFTKNVGSGETWENVLIDISAPGATYQIQADGSNWTIRNIGITGHYEGGHTEAFRARVTDPNGTGTIENVYVAPTVGDGNATGLYVYWNHVGHIEIDQFNVQNWTDNGIYASGPGNSTAHPNPGSGGTLTIRNSYSKNNDKSNFRLGTHGSKLVNCCAAGGSSRGHWQFYESAEIVDCDLGGHTSDLALGDAVWEKSNHASLEMSSSRWESAHSHGRASTANIDGTPQGSTVDRIPEGCPTSAEEAASGNGSGDEPAPEPEPEPEFPEDGHLVAFVTEPDTAYAAHEFHADGPVSFAEAPYDSPSGKSIEGGTFKSRDFVDEVDGSWHAGGTTGGGAGDAYVVEGPVTSVSVDQPDVMWIELDGERVSKDELVSKTGGDQDDEETGDESDVVAFVTEPDAAYASHEFYADGPVSFAEAPYDSPSGKSIEGGTYSSRDFVEEADGSWHAGGTTGGGAGDAYTVEGPVTSVSVDQPDVMWIELNGERVSETELVERTGGDPGDDPEPETHTLEVAGRFDYRIEVSGEIQPAESHAQWLSEGEAYGTDWAEWWLSGTDSARTVWEFTGEITNLEIDDHDGATDLRTLAVDGEELDHSEYVDTGPHRLEVAGQFAYRVEVSGEISPADAHTRWLTAGRAYGDDWAEWWLSGADSARTVWEFTGEITGLDVDDYDGVTDVRTLTVDGKPIEDR